MESTAQTFLDTLMSEHREVRSLLSSIAEEVDRAAASGGVLDKTVLRRALKELERIDIPHHVHESHLLFPRIRLRCPPLAPVLDRLEAEHDRMEPLYRQLASTPDRNEPRKEAVPEEFGRLFKHFVEIVFGHMSVEEDYILPVAADFLTAEDWEEMHSASPP